MKALILAAGYATRLYPLTRDYPKPLLKIGTRPIINHIIDKLVEIDGLNEIIVVTNSKFISVFRKWAAKLDLDIRLTLVDDKTKDHDDRLGAIGDMNFVINKRRIKDDLLVVGGDNLFEDSLGEFMVFARKRRKSPVIGIYNIKSKTNATSYGVVKLDRKQRIVDFEEKPQRPKTTLIAMCLYYFPKDKLYLTKDYFETKALQYDATGFYINWLKTQCYVYGFTFKGRWYDIGHRKFYDEANSKFAN